MTDLTNVRAIATFHENISGHVTRTHVSVLTVGADYRPWSNTFLSSLTEDEARALACEHLSLADTEAATFTRTDIYGGFILTVHL
jgi:hypothetical protein